MPLEHLKTILLQTPEVKKHYENLKPEFSRSAALCWWRNLTTEERKHFAQKSSYAEFIKELDFLGSNSLTGRMIEEIYLKNKI